MAQKQASTCRSCVDNMLQHHYSYECGPYNAQAAFNTRMRKLWASGPDWRTARLPGPSPDFPLVSVYSNDHGRGFDIKPDPDKRELYRLLASDGAAYTAFRAAVRKAEAARERETTLEAA